MTSYKRVIPATALVGTIVVASVFVTYMTSRLRHTRQSREKAALAGWEDEGGSVAAPHAPSRT